MCAMQPNLVKIPFFLALDFLLKTALLRSVKHCNLTLHSYFLCKSSQWSLQGQKYLPEFQLSHYYPYSFVASTPIIAFLFLDARFYLHSFVLKQKTLIYPKKITFFQSLEAQFIHFVHQTIRCC